VTDPDGDMLLEIALTIEEITHESFNDKYKSRIRSLVSNLKDRQNTLRDDVIQHKLTPTVFAHMTTDEMVIELLTQMSKQRKKEVEHAYKEIMLESVSATQMHATTDMFRCGKCGKRKTTYYQVSLD
jgi:transcription elongation factor S-II